jgi:hypothetical protein
MEPHKSEKLVESRGEGQTSRPCQREKKPRFQIMKLEPRIAPGGGHGHHGVRVNHNEILVRDVPRKR